MRTRFASSLVILLLSWPAAAAVPDGRNGMGSGGPAVMPDRVRLALNPQPIPPRTARARVAPGDGVTLNPQPIPPRERPFGRSRSR